MRIIRGWSKNPSPPRIIIDLHPSPEVRFENITTDVTDGTTLAKSLAELKKRDYILAVHEESMSHHFASGELGIPAERLLLCKTPEESIERLLLSGIPRPAHILLTDEPHATQIHGKNPAGTEILFARGSKKELPQYEDAIAVRSDWPVLVGAINEALSFLKRNGSIERLGHQELGALTGVQLVA